MKEILKYLKTHVKEDFQLHYYASIGIFLIVCISINYYLDFEDSIIDSYYGQNIRILYFFLFYAFAYYGSTVIMVYYKKRFDILKSREFWIKSVFILGLLALDAGFHYHDVFISESIPPAAQYFSKKVSVNMINILTMIIPLILFYRLYNKGMKSFYGLTTRGFNYRPYLSMLLIMMPLIFAASFIDNFTDFYPIYNRNLIHRVLQVDEWIPALIYELTYGWNFLTIELAFRGFMILALAGTMGRNVVIPMVVAYCFYHFGKPEGEAMSSIIGGYILGVIALESRSILGGVMIHIGVAWLMEFFAYLQQ